MRHLALKGDQGLDIDSDFERCRCREQDRDEALTEIEVSETEIQGTSRKRHNEPGGGLPTEPAFHQRGRMRRCRGAAAGPSMAPGGGGVARRPDAGRGRGAERQARGTGTSS